MTFSAPRSILQTEDDQEPATRPGRVAVMPSPFPGMDPYLEGDLWTTVHSQLAAEIARQLAPKIAPRYIARTEKRFVIAAPADLEEAEISIYTDLGVRTAKARQ